MKREPTAPDRRREIAGMLSKKSSNASLFTGTSAIANKIVKPNIQKQTIPALDGLVPFDRIYLSFASSRAFFSRLYKVDFLQVQTQAFRGPHGVSVVP